jgi:hypothetical protein
MKQTQERLEILALASRDVPLKAVRKSCRAVARVINTRRVHIVDVTKAEFTAMFHLDVICRTRADGNTQCCDYQN